MVGIFRLSIVIVSEDWFNKNFISYFKKENPMTSSNECDVCNKPSAWIHCTGCDKYFCSKDFKRHREVLFGETDKIVESRDELQEAMNRSMQSDDQQSSLLAKIDEWKRTTIKKVLVRHQVTNLLNINRIKIHTKFKNFSQELARLRESEDFIERDLTRLNKLLDQFILDIKLHTEERYQNNKNQLVCNQNRFSKRMNSID